MTSLDLDETPAIPMWWESHLTSKGGVRGSTHDALNAAAGGAINEAFLNTKFSNPATRAQLFEQLLDDLEDAYRDQLSHPGLALAFRKWFRDRGI